MVLELIQVLESTRMRMARLLMLLWGGLLITEYWFLVLYLQVWFQGTAAGVLQACCSKPSKVQVSF